jgi:hypothetical protein
LKRAKRKKRKDKGPLPAAAPATSLPSTRPWRQPGLDDGPAGAGVAAPLPRVPRAPAGAQALPLAAAEFSPRP